MLNFTSRTTYYLSSTPTDMRNGREGLAGIIREKMQHDPYSYDEAFIFYSKDYRKVKILHYDINGLSYTRSGLMMVSFSSLVSWRQLAVIR